MGSSPVEALRCLVRLTCLNKCSSFLIKTRRSIYGRLELSEFLKLISEVGFDPCSSRKDFPASSGHRDCRTPLLKARA